MDCRRAVIENVVARADDEAILQMMKQAGKTGIDCPFGWPDAFVEFVTSHRAGHLGVLADGHGWRRNLTMRRIDVFVYEQLRLTPSASQLTGSPMWHFGARPCSQSSRLRAARWTGPGLALSPRSTRPPHCAAGAWITAATSRRPPPVPSQVSLTICWTKHRGWTARPTSRLCAGHTTSSMQSSPR